VAAEGIWILAELPLDRPAERAKLAATIDAHAARTARLFVAVDDLGRLVGSLGVHEARGVAALGMNVDTGHRGSGVGTALMGPAIGWAREVGAHKVELEHWPWNHAARRLYERFGFVEEGYRRRQHRRRDGSLWDAVLMGLVLDEVAPGHEFRAPGPPGPAG